MPGAPSAQPAFDPPPGGPPRAVAERLGYLLKHTHEAYRALQAPALAPLELDGRLLAVLALVDAVGPALQQRLAERLGVDRTTMVALIDALEECGLVARGRDPVDRRGYRIAITRKGTTVLAEAMTAVDAAEQSFLTRLSDTERRQFRRLLAKLAAPGA